MRGLLLRGVQPGPALGLALGLLLLAAVVSVQAPPPARADDADRGAAALAAADEALAKKAWIIARETYERALKDDSTRVEAWLGIGHALLGEQRQDEALAALRRGLAALEVLAPLTDERIVRYEQALKQLGDLSKEDADLAALARKQSDALYAIGRRYANKDPEAAREALRQALRLAPENRRVADLLSRTDDLAPGRAIPLLSGPAKGMWSWMSPAEWTHTEGLLVAKVPNAAMLVRYDRTWSGDHDVLMEARLVEEFTRDGPAMFALCPGWNDEDDANVLGFLAGRILWRDERGTGEVNRTDLYDSPVPYVAKDFDPTTWCSYEVRFKGDSMSAWINGKQVAKGRRPSHRMNGFVCLKVQNCHVEFRRVDVTPR